MLNTLREKALAVYRSLDSPEWLLRFPLQTKGQASFDIEIATLARFSRRTGEQATPRKASAGGTVLIRSVEVVEWELDAVEECEAVAAPTTTEQRQQFHLVNVCPARRRRRKRR